MSPLSFNFEPSSGFSLFYFVYKVEIKWSFLKRYFGQKRKVTFEIIFHSCKILQYLRVCSDLGRNMSGISKLLHKVEVWSFCFHAALLQNYLVKPRERNQCIFSVQFPLEWSHDWSCSRTNWRELHNNGFDKRKTIKKSNFSTSPSLKDKKTPY